MVERDEADRAARNEALFRRVNERVEDINKAFEPILGETDFFCECADIDCMERIRMSLQEYEALRQAPKQFAVKPGHERSSHRARDRRAGGLRDRGEVGHAGERAEQLDPRE